MKEQKGTFKSIRITFRTPSEITIFSSVSFKVLKIKYCQYGATTQGQVGLLQTFIHMGHVIAWKSKM